MITARRVTPATQFEPVHGMLARYTEQARRAIFFARDEASQFGAKSIESEHLLLGLGRDYGAKVSFGSSRIALEEMRGEIQRRKPASSAVK
jgi:hypothetical protein